MGWPDIAVRAADPLTGPGGAVTVPGEDVLEAFPRLAVARGTTQGHLDRMRDCAH
jgi:hypothetical protein